MATPALWRPCETWMGRSSRRRCTHGTPSAVRDFIRDTTKAIVPRHAPTQVYFNDTGIAEGEITALMFGEDIATTAKAAGTHPPETSPNIVIHVFVAVVSEYDLYPVFGRPSCVWCTVLVHCSARLPRLSVMQVHGVLAWGPDLTVTR